MVLAERTRATGTIALCSVFALATAALSITAPRAMHGWRHGHRHHHSRVSFDQPGCREWIPPPAPAALPPPPVHASHDGYGRVLERATPQLAACFTRDHAPVGVLLTIAPDGRVRAVSTRPDRETAHTRCVERVAAELLFPPASHTVMLRTELPAGE